MSKANMSRRIRRQYQALLEGDVTDYYYPYAWWGGKTSDNNAWCALFFWRQFGRRKGVDFHRVQNIALSGPAEVAYRWALEVPGANVRKCQAAVMQRGSVELLRAFAKHVPGAWTKGLEDLAVVKEVLGQ